MAVATLFILGCSSEPIRLYAGPARPAGEVSVLKVPEAVEVISVNGAEIKGARGLMRRGDATLELAPGCYEVLAYYREIWQLGDDHDSLRSDPALFDVVAEPGRHYALDYERPQNYAQAQRLAARFSGWTQEESSGARMLSRPSGLQFSREALAGDALVGAPQRPEGTQVVAPLPAPGADPLAGLKDGWRQATPEQRREFLGWISHQP